MDMKDHILAAMKEQLDRWETTLADLAESQITAADLPGRWSVKDILAHLMAWQQRSIARINAALEDREPVYPRWNTEAGSLDEGDLNETNAWIYEHYREQPWSSVHENWYAGFLRFIELGRGISERDLLDGDRYAWLGGYPLAVVYLASFEHHKEHLEKLQAWLEQSSI
jgi:hypothetical protein